MILTCPQCASRYFVDDTKVGPEGRDVRCASCGNRWRASAPYMRGPADEASAAVAAAGAASSREVTPDATAQDAGAPDGAAAASGADPAAGEPIVAPVSPSAGKAGSKKKPAPAAAKQKREAAVAGLVWAGLAFVLAAILAAAVVYRVDVVRLVPRSASAYAAVGLPVNNVGLVIEQLRAEPSLQDGHAALTVTGVLRNVAGRDVAAPPLRVTLLNPAGKPVAGKIAAAADPRIPAGQTRHFAVALLDPPSTAKDLEVGFVLDGATPALKAPVPPAAAHAEAEAAPHLRGSDGAVPPAGSHPEPAAAPAAADAHAAPAEHH